MSLSTRGAYAEAFCWIKGALLAAYACLPNQSDRHNFDWIVRIGSMSIETFVLYLKGCVQRLHCRFSKVLICHWEAYF